MLLYSTNAPKRLLLAFCQTPPGNFMFHIHLAYFCCFSYSSGSLFYVCYFRFRFSLFVYMSVYLSCGCHGSLNCLNWIASCVPGLRLGHCYVIVVQFSVLIVEWDNSFLIRPDPSRFYNYGGAEEVTRKVVCITVLFLGSVLYIVCIYSLFVTMSFSCIQSLWGVVVQASMRGSLSWSQWSGRAGQAELNHYQWKNEV